MNKLFIAALFLIASSGAACLFSANIALVLAGLTFIMAFIAWQKAKVQLNNTENLMLLEDLRYAKAVCDKKGNILSYNIKGAELFGTQGFVLDNVKALLDNGISDNDSNFVLLSSAFVLQADIQALLTLKSENDNDTARSYLIEIRRITGKDKFLVTAWDKTEETKLSLLSQQERRDMFLLFDTLPFGIYICDKDGKISFANLALCQLLGIEAAAAKGIYLNDFTASDDKIDFTSDIGKDVLFMLKGHNPHSETCFVCQKVKIEQGKTCARGAVIAGASKITDKDKELADTRNHISWLFGETPFGIALVKSDGQVYEVNPTLAKMLGTTTGNITNHDIFSIMNEENSASLKEKMAKVASGAKDSLKCEIRTKKGDGNLIAEKIFEVFIRPTKDVSRANKEKITGLILHFFDATEWKNLEVQFEQAQKMQAMGQLAGGIAHNFNNTLTTILGYAEFLLARHGAGDPSFTDIMHIINNANRSANLVRQLLAFSRKQSLTPRITDATEAVADILDMLRLLVGGGIQINVNYGRDLGYIRADQGQLSQVFANLAINSRHAMNDNGTITFDVKNFDITEPLKSNDEVIPVGSFVRFDFTDTGSGIKKENIKRIFEPFFSTKSDTGEGTGLGLAMVYGVIRQTEGYIQVQSQEGKGTTFTILLPRYDKPKDYIPLKPSSFHQGKPDETVVTITASSPLGKEAADIEVTPSINPKAETGSRILLAEDEAGVRLFASRALRNRGFHITECPDGVTALEKVKSGEKFDLLLTDMVMLGMNGVQLAKEVRKILPDIKIIIMSGFSEDIAKGEIADEEEIAFLAKPFNLEQITTIVKKTIS